MKTKHLLVAALMMAVCLGANAQERVDHGRPSHNLYVGFTPFAMRNIKLSSKDVIDYRYNYKSAWGLQANYEKQFKTSWATLWELQYSNAKLDDVDYKKVPTDVSLLPNEVKDMYAIAVKGYFGKVFNNYKRVQFPIYIGAGWEYINAEAMHHSFLTFGFKARIKCYVSGNIALYAGVNGEYGLSDMHVPNYTGSKKKPEYDLTNKNGYIDAGIVIGLK